MSAEEEYIVRLLVTLPDGTSIIEHPDGRLERQRSQTDWARLDALTDEEIEAAMRDDPDWAALIDMDWSDAVLVVPKTRPVVLNLDWEVFEFFEHIDADEIAAVRRQNFDDREPPHRLQRVVRCLAIEGELRAPRFQQRGADHWEGVDAPGRDDAADEF